MSAPQCNDCRHWKFDETTIDKLDPDWGFGFCRRQPPVLISSAVAALIVPPRYGGTSDLERLDPSTAWAASLWPSTFATEACGEYSEAS